MGKTTDRELAIEEKKAEVANLIRKAESDCGKKNVTYFTGEDGSSIIRIKNSRGTVSRKEHTLPEHVRKNGD